MGNEASPNVKLGKRSRLRSSKLYQIYRRRSVCVLISRTNRRTAVEEKCLLTPAKAVRAPTSATLEHLASSSVATGNDNQKWNYLTKTENPDPTTVAPPALA